ncbi:FixH family protein [Helicobacter baculiformis]|uniref:FixH family protein n=1 Tax=Helicobacter baculiformis TaxID=427351 RepID=A0ABV7ZHE9_9HELI|nr:FixH family protein [Helicobacter baculiformis]
MKKWHVLALACALSLGSLQAWDLKIVAKEIGAKGTKALLRDQKPAGDDKVTALLKSDQKLSSGDNHFTLTPTLHGKALEKARIELKFSMPEMPGMPAMHEKAQVKEKEGVYNAQVNLPMVGTWQIKLEIKTKEGKLYKGKGSIDL